MIFYLLSALVRPAWLAPMRIPRDEDARNRMLGYMQAGVAADRRDAQWGPYRISPDQPPYLWAGLNAALVAETINSAVAE
ncbi:transcriptional regulator [uncultured Sulfitobacter sp.]|uniref:transcriptional regulator n=1 Tax=uncultured Sulfitobacter sp. TaxID=191468 RepID=UPI0030DCB232